MGTIRSIVGLLFVIAGILSFFVGGLLWFFVELYDFFQSAQAGSADLVDIFWLIVSWIVRPIISLIVGAILIFIGKLIIGE